MVVASLVRRNRSRCRSTAQTEVRSPPPTPTSEVTEAMSRWEAETRRRYAGNQGLASPWCTRHATSIWCMAKIIAVEAQCSASTSHTSISSRIEHPPPPRLVGTYADRSRAWRSAQIASSGKRPSRSTALAWREATVLPISSARSRRVAWSDVAVSAA